MSANSRRISNNNVKALSISVLLLLGVTSAFSPASPLRRLQLKFPSGNFPLHQSSESEFPTSSPFETKKDSNNNNNEYSFFDEVSIYVRAGSGGQGSSTWKKAKKGANGIPDGGSGGIGGNIIFEVDASLNTLASFTGTGTQVNDNQNTNALVDGSSSSSARQRLMSFRAQTGRPGGRMYDNGRGGEDCTVRVPPGTVVCIEHEVDETMLDTDDDGMEWNEASADKDDSDEDEEDSEENEYRLSEIGSLSIEQPTLMIARGGLGGEGTATLKGKKKGATRRGPEGGQRFRLRLTLKIVADVALVGVPNAGKSTFLAAVTRAEPKIANYPFTTLVPNLGVWIPKTAGAAGSSYSSGDANKDTRGGDKAAGSTGIVLCDVPGLIEGAAEGVGLGHSFLRHVERCRVILHLVDATSEEPVGDYEMVNREMQRYGTGSLASKPQVVVVNKIDTWEEEGTEEFNNRKAALEEALKASMGHTRVMWVSAKERQNMDELMIRMQSYITKIKDEDNSKAPEEPVIVG